MSTTTTTTTCRAATTSEDEEIQQNDQQGQQEEEVVVVECEANVGEDTTTKCLRMLVLHGKGSSGEDFTNRLTAYHEVLKEDHQTELEIISLDAPFPLKQQQQGQGGGEGEGYAWWTMPPGVRSFQATEYEGFEISSDLVLQTIDREGPFDLIYGHSQGAILTASLLALQRFKTPSFPRKGFLLNGVAWPNPFKESINNLQYNGSTKTETTSTPPPPRVLIITGERDKINPPSTQEQVKSALQKAGAHVEVITHPAGHNIPTKKDEILDNILDWILR